MNIVRDNVFLGGTDCGIRFAADGPYTLTFRDNIFRDNFFAVALTMTRLQQFTVWLHWLLLISLLFLLSACASQPYPITSGSHTQVQPQNAKYVIWSNHAGVNSYLTGVLLQLNQRVVERTRLDQVFKEQKVRLSHTSDGDVLKVGRLVGATQVIFADVELVDREGFFTVDRRTSVTLRSVEVESGEVLWAGSARYLEPMANPDQAVVALSYWALMRAMCAETWEEPSRWNKGGCQTAHASKVQVKTVEERPEPTIWREMKEHEHGR